jgi:hypothetical protein
MRFILQLDVVAKGQRVRHSYRYSTLGQNACIQCASSALLPSLCTCGTRNTPAKQEGLGGDAAESLSPRVSTNASLSMLRYAGQRVRYAAAACCVARVPRT